MLGKDGSEYCVGFPPENYLFIPLMYFSMAIVMEGVSLLGAITSTRKPASSAAFCVVFPKTAILISPCLKSLKFCCKERIPCGLKNTSMSYSFTLISERSEQTVFYIIARVHSTFALSKVAGISGLITSDVGIRYFSEGYFLKSAAKSEKFFSPKAIFLFL